MPPTPWPPDVPNCLSLDTYLEERQPLVIRSPVDSGPHKLRRRYTKPVVGIIGNIFCKKDELEKLWDFFDVTLQGGTQEFENTNPIDGKTYTYRFLQPPRLTSVLNEDNFSVELIMEQY